MKFLRDAFENTNSKLFWPVNDILALVILVSTAAVFVETDPTLYAQHKTALIIIDWVAAIIFTIEYIIYISLAKKKLAYIFSFYGIIDLLSFLPTFLGAFNLQFLKSFRVLRLVRLLRLFRVLHVLEIAKKKIEKGAKEMDILRTNLIVYLIFFFIFLLTCSMLLFSIEQGAPGAYIHDLEDAVWSTFSGMSSVGFGDTFPVTFPGRMLMGMIMLTGVGFLSFAVVIFGRFFQKILFGNDIEEELERLK